MRELFSDAQRVVSLIQILAAVGIVVSTAEWLANWRQLGPGGIYSWRVLGSRPALVDRPTLWRMLGWLMEPPVFIAVLALRLVAAGLLVLGPLPPASLTATALTVVVISTLIVNYRSILGQDGSDQMASIVFIALWINLFATEENGIAELCLAFIAAQACLSYLVSGIAKLAGRKWRRGEALFGIFNTATYGMRPIASFLKGHPTMSKVLCWSAVVAECAFPLALVVGHPLALVFIAWGVAFHFANAVVMGLNSFFWSFTSTYPAVLFVGFLLRPVVTGM